jgi:outer membrane protein TolC
MKVHVFVVLMLLVAVADAQQLDTAVPDSDLVVGAEGILPSAEQHHAATTLPLTLAELEAAALANNAEIHAATRQVAVAETRRGSAGALNDPSFMYRGWGTPLAKPWDLNQTQHMFMFSQELPGGGKRQLRARLADDDIDIAKADLETKKRDVLAQVRRSFYELLRNQDELRFHDEQAALARQGLESARIKYVVGKVPQQDMLKAQIALTRLAEHLVMLQQDSDLARSRLNTLLGRDPAAPLEILGAYSPVTKLPGLIDMEKMALENRPELVAISAAIQQDETRTQLAEKSLKPDYTLSGGSQHLHGGALGHFAMAESRTPRCGNRRGPRHDHRSEGRLRQPPRRRFRGDTGISGESACRATACRLVRRHVATTGPGSAQGNCRSLSGGPH